MLIVEKVTPLPEAGETFTLADLNGHARMTVLKSNVKTVFKP